MRVLVGVLLGLMVLAHEPAARACSVNSPDPGLSLYTEENDDRTLAADGVLAIDGYVFDMSVAAATESLDVAVTLEGAPVAGAIEVQTLRAGVYDSGGIYAGTRESYQVLIVWRPAAPLVAGEYAVTLTWDPPPTEIYGPMDPPPEQRLTRFTATGEVGPPPAAPALVGGPADIVAEELARACCATFQSSCGGDSLCRPIEVRHEPGFRFGAVAAADQRERVILWTAEVKDGVVGEPTITSAPWPGWRGEIPLFSQLPMDTVIRFADVRDEYCVVIGATSLIDGTSATGTPVCAAMPAPYDETLTPEFTQFDPETFEGECLGPPVYEDDGAPYPEGAEEQSGCRSGERGPWGLAVLAGLLLVRVRRRGA